ncbi:MAG: TIGR01777 family protein [Candidatus Eisenbacteria bacterium]|nr:TIGR01777 family protein [Candidatus Eisenbacteria bacterium]
MDPSHADPTPDGHPGEAPTAREEHAGNPRVLVSGASGLVGSRVCARLAAAGASVTALGRDRGGPPAAGFLPWDPERGELDGPALEGLDAVVHLAGENISAGRWTAERRRRIRSSRVDGTRLLAGRLAGLAHPPRVMVCASAVGYYGDRGAEWLTEDSPPGQGFMAELCRDWEAACGPAGRAGIRVVSLRTGVVLTSAGGMLPRLIPLFRLGLGGRLGGGGQYMPWIAMEDLLEVIRRALTDDSLRGPVNAVAPQAVTNAEFTRALAAALRRPAGFAVPAFALRLALGGMADGLLLASARVRPARLEAAGYDFRLPGLDAALAGDS